MSTPVVNPVLGSDEIGYLCGPHSAEGVSFADAWIHGGDGSAGATLSRVNDYARRSGVPSRRIDDILTGGAPLHTEVAFRAPVGEVWASDHFGLVSDVSTKA